MSHIHSFQIHGLNGRKMPVRYELDRHINVFFGSNGSGKTSILKILNSAMAGEVSTIRTVAFTRAKISIESIKYKRQFSIEYEKIGAEQVIEESEGGVLQLNADSPVGQYIGRAQRAAGWSIHPVPDDGLDESAKRGWQHTYLPTSRLYTGDRFIPSRLAQESQFSESSLDKHFASHLQNIWRQKYGAILRQVGLIQQEGLKNILLEILIPEQKSRSKSRVSKENIDADKAFERMTTFLRRQSNARDRRISLSKDEFARRFRDEANLRNIVNHIDHLEDEIENQMRPIKQISDLVTELFSRGKIISFDGPNILIQSDSGDPIAIENLSSGEKHLIRIFLAAIDAEESSLIIDEPELSMHIDWQRQLVKNVRVINPNCQIILATHSPEVMADVDDEKIFRV